MTIQQAFELALQHHQAGRLAEAEAIYRQVLAVQPRHADALHGLGVIAAQSGRHEIAVNTFRQVIAFKGNYPEAHSNLGNVLSDMGRMEEAVIAYRQAITIRPHFPAAYNNLGNALKEVQRHDEAIASFRQAVNLQPDFAEAHFNLGNTLKDLGQADLAIGSYRQAVALRPDFAAARSNLVLALHYHPSCDARHIAEEHRLWNHQHAVPLKDLIRSHTNSRDPDRRLRIGYVSPDLREHVVGRYLVPLLANHDKGQVEVFAYAQVSAPDAMTHRLQGYTDHWRSIVGQSDAEVAAGIQEDRIDILVDLAMHTANNRLPVFAHRPAPVQVSFAAYPGSTGLEAIGHRISDRHLEGGSAAEAYGGRERVSLIESFWCFDPPDCAGLEVRGLPAVANGRVTFGCLCNFSKVNDSVLSLWAGVLRAVPASRLLLLCLAGSHRERTLAFLRQLGVDSARVEFEEPRPRRGYLELYRRMDIGLDTFPYNGHTTSLDAFWMGVPVIALVGQLPVARAGLSNLMNLGLPELVAHSGGEYVKIASELAADLPRLAALRATLRERMERSVLMDAPRFARQIEAAFRNMWRERCGCDS